MERMPSAGVQEIIFFGRVVPSPERDLLSLFFFGGSPLRGGRRLSLLPE